MKSNLFILILIFFCTTSFSQTSGSDFYSITKVVESIGPQDIENHRGLKITPPDVLYHWISVVSVFRLFQGYSLARPFPMKVMGNDDSQPLLTSKVQPLFKKKGLFAWHNPIGATIGGSGEIYGNNEAVLALKIDPKARIGLIVTDENYHMGSKKINDPKILNNYDIILHVSGGLRNQTFYPGFIEWTIINPEIITEFTLDTKIISKEMIRFQKELIKSKPSKNAPLIEKIAGLQHSGLGSYSINATRIQELINRIANHQAELSELSFSQGWHPRPKKCHHVVGVK